MGDFFEYLNEQLNSIEKAKEFGGALAKVDTAVMLNDARTKENLSQAEIARRLGVSQSYISKLEKGDANPSISKIGQFLGVLGLRMSLGYVPLRTQPIDLAFLQYETEEEHPGINKDAETKSVQVLVA